MFGAANEHGLPDHAPHSITGERDEEREEPGSFSPSVTFRLMRPRRGSYFLILTGWCPLALRGLFSLLHHIWYRCGWRGDSEREKSQIKPSTDIKSRKLSKGNPHWINYQKCTKHIIYQVFWCSLKCKTNLTFPQVTGACLFHLRMNFFPYFKWNNLPVRGVFFAMWNQIATNH